MKILIIGGFLGSGKTTVLKKIAISIVSGGQSVAIIENEIGEIGIDQDIIEEIGVSVTPIFGGCVCCQLTGNLFEGIKEVKADLNPDWLLIECTGFAIMTEIIEAFHANSDPDVPAYTISVLDISRFKIFMKAMRSVIASQLDGVDLVLVNKTDIAPLLEQDKTLISEMSAQAVILTIAATEIEDDKLWKTVSNALFYQ